MMYIVVLNTHKARRRDTKLSVINNCNEWVEMGREHKKSIINTRNE